MTGVLLAGAVSELCMECLPCVGKGVPWAVNGIMLLNVFSPHKQGCSDGCGNRKNDFLVFLA